MGSGRERGSWLETLAKVTAAVVAVGCGASNGDEAAGAATGALPLSRIALENQLPGSEDYQVSVHVEHRELEAYAGAVSVTGGEALDVHVNVSVRSAVKWQLFRLGYYRGRGARRLADGLVTEVQPEPDCPVDRHTGLIECSWDTTFAIPIDPKWVSGYYLVKLTRDDGFESTVPFVVRESEPTAPVLVQASMNTWQAYNRWGGASLYHNDLGSKAFKATHAFRVSYDRPYGTGDGAGRLFDLEIWLVKWLEERGVEVAYTTNVDVDRAPETLLSRRIVVVSGHDEYWTLGERRALEATRDAGVSLAVLSANTGYWRVRFDPSSAGADRRIITCYKSAKDDPDDDAPDTTVRFRDAPHARPENELTGVLYQLGDYPLASLPTYVADPTHWVFEGTGVKTGDRLGVTLGGEWDEAISDASEPAGVEFVTASPAFDSSGGVTSSAGALYAPTDHSFVFASGSEQFALGLSEPHTVAPRTQRVLHNLLVRAGVADPAPLTPCAPTPRTVWPGQVSVLAGSGEAGHHDGPATEALFDAPGGLALGADGTLYVTESRNHDVRALAPDGTVSTLAGCGPFGSRDGGYASGTGKDACFNRPNGIAVRDD
ncbi:MAG TPA: N,N-dimethylformamidase beta subunit family domain-containing protein, partial [Polyangiaceae bacterium]|nr:N,N-dimethylformamidase beta subunit family domain-containing protein [Polyangiaceae bacterium]